MDGHRCRQATGGDVRAGADVIDLLWAAHLIGTLLLLAHLRRRDEQIALRAWLRERVERAASERARLNQFTAPTRAPLPAAPADRG
jgi:hypothetical protein